MSGIHDSYSRISRPSSRHLPRMVRYMWNAGVCWLLACLSCSCMQNICHALMAYTFHGLRQDHDQFTLNWMKFKIEQFLHGHWKVQEMQFKFPVQCCSRKCTLNLYISWLLKCTWNATHKFPVLKGNVPEIWHFLVTKMYRK